MIIDGLSVWWVVTGYGTNAKRAHVMQHGKATN